MIQRTAPAWQTPEWQTALRDAFTDAGELIEFLQLDRDLLPAARAAEGIFPLKVPRAFANLIEKSNPQDPILRQILPLGEELTPHQDFSEDPVGDLATEVLPGVLHKYQGRVLLIASGACGVHCRYCFRRHFPYSDSLAGRNHWSQALEYLSDQEDVREVILSGGDPLILSDEHLASLIHSLEQIPHIKRLRLHSRLPVTLPQRITTDLISLLSESHFNSTLVLHINHPAEISDTLRHGLMLLKREGITLLNQSVLLKGVNDSTETLAKLSDMLFDAGILPYYLHLLDRVQGAAHFEVQREKALELQRALQEQLPGYLVPKLVQECSGERSKTAVI